MVQRSGRDSSLHTRPVETRLCADPLTFNNNFLSLKVFSLEGSSRSLTEKRANPQGLSFIQNVVNQLTHVWCLKFAFLVLHCS